MPKIKKEKPQLKKITAPKVKKSKTKPRPLPKAAKKPAKILAVVKKIAPKAHAASKVKATAIHKPIVKEPVLKKEPIIPAPVAPHAAIPVTKEIPKPKKEAAVTPPKKETPEIKKEVPIVKKELPEAKAPAPAPAVALKELEIKIPVTLKDLAIQLQEKPSSLIKILMDKKMMVGINQALDEKTAGIICEKFGYEIKQAPGEEEVALRIHSEQDKPQMLKSRPAIVTFMGHVDHGKTSLLDAIRKTKVADSEHGGITQHIGAYRVKLPDGAITFLDTPGHEAFTAMRARGARITDVVVLVVAADDGIMPQTQEAIDHARAAGVSIIVAINKIDKPQADIDRVKKQLSTAGLAAEDWGGKTITVPVSAKTGDGINNLLEMIILEAQMLELKGNPDKPAKGIVIEAKMAKGRGPVSTLLIQNGTLHLNDNIIVGHFYGKIRAMFDDHGNSVAIAGISFPVEALGISGIPAAGEQFFVIGDEKTAKELAAKRQEEEKEKQMKSVKRVSLEDLHARIAAGKLKELKLIIKADVQGSLEAIKDVLDKLNISEIKVDIIHAGVGNINASDAILAIASDALILGFNIVADDGAKELAAKEGVDIRIYNIIYELGADIKAAIEGMLEPKLKKVFLGRVEVRKVFQLTRSGMVAGCMVVKNKINRSATVDVVRNGEVVFEGKISSLKRFKDDVRDVQEGFECGITIGGFDQLKEGDIIEAYEIERIARKL